ncbi:hypothetical protein HBH69_060220 [Parastagonospora nodorum]|nr:hypothetical protein HBH69_060220 [Parastagonospora nodorum]KAH6329595.1 hypothetical protein HBI37_192560 [Parastagonospora nodorum]KAH6342687.1 hypothetical protein HBI36_182230 [Parastagonospora nodorum]
MAVHPEYPGLTVQVVVNGEPLPEYEDEDATDVPKVVTKYIEAQAGTEFEIVQVFPDGFAGSDDVRTRCYIDNQEVHSPISTSISRQTGGIVDHSSFKCCVSVSLPTLLIHAGPSLIVSEVEASDMDDPGEAATIGTIKLDLQRGKKLGSTQPSLPIHSRGPEQVSEAALKGEAKSLQVKYVVKIRGKSTLSLTNDSLGPGKKTLRRKMCGFEQKGTESVATFIFKYRSRANLQALHIVPRDESPPPPAIVKSKSSSPVLAPQNKPAVKNEILLDAMPVPPQVAGTILHAHRAASISVSVPELQQSTPRSTPMPPVASVPTEPVSQQQTLTPPASTNQDGLTTEEVIVMIAGYRGHDRGLAGRSQRSLLSLLKHYESKDSGSTQVVKGPGLVDERVSIKRERSDDSVVGGRQKKRKETEVIVLDD